MIVLLAVVVFVAKFFWLLVAFAAAAVIGRTVGGGLAHHDDSVLERCARDAQVRARADQQQAWTLAGDPRGTYGIYPPC